MQCIVRALLIIILVQWALLTYILVQQHHHQHYSTLSTATDESVSQLLPVKMLESAHTQPFSDSTLPGPIKSVIYAGASTTTNKSPSSSTNLVSSSFCPKICSVCTTTSDTDSITTTSTTAIAKTTSTRREETNNDNQYDGVAVTFLLKAPKWFQRRYTVVIQNVLANIPPTWAVQIFITTHEQSQMGIQINMGLQRLIHANPRVYLTTIPQNVTQTTKTKNQLLQQQWIWQSMIANRVFVFGGNGVICGNSHVTISHFDTLDYVGNPWNRFHGMGGDGSEYSLRNRQAMLLALQYRKQNHDKQREDGNEREDIMFVRTLLEMNHAKLTNWTIATMEQTELFGGTKEFTVRFNESLSSKNYERVGPSLVISGTLPRLPHDVRDKFLHVCPELKVIFPSLHSPFCFGAKPDGIKCAETICALSDPSMRKGGC